MLRLFLTVALTCMLAACAQPTSPPGSPPSGSPPAAGNCQAAPAQFAIGYAVTRDLLEEARRRAGASRVRVIQPGQVVTMEFAADRLNVEVSEANRVLRVRCG